MDNEHIETAIVPVDQVQALVAGRQEVGQFAAILKKILQNGDKLSDEEALAGAVYAKMTGQIPGRDFYIAPNFGVIPGYQGEQKQAVEAAPKFLPPEYRAMTEEEADFNDIAPGDKAAICEIWVPARMREARELGMKPRPIVGVGIVRKSEQWVSFEWRSASSGKRYKAALPESEWKDRTDPPTGRSWGWVARNRAYKDALRHLPSHQDAESILVEGARRGLVVEVPEGAQLSPEQARLMIESAQQDAERPELTYEQHQERLRANTERMRGPSWDAFDEAAEGEYRIEVLDADGYDADAANGMTELEQFATTYSDGTPVHPEPTTNDDALPFHDQGTAVKWAIRFEYYQKDGKPDPAHAVGSINKICKELNCNDREVECWGNAFYRHVMSHDLDAQAAAEA